MERERLVKKILVFAATSILTMTVSISQAMAQAAPASIKLGAVIALTGAMASGGKDVKAGYEIAIKHINDAGGVFVKEYNKKLPLELVILDDESDAVKTTARLDKLYSVDNVVCYLGGFSSDLNVVGMSTAEKNKIPWIGVTVAAETPFKRGFKYVFVPFSLANDQARTFYDLLDSIPKDQRPTKIGHMELQVDWGKECGAYIREMAKKRGYTVVAELKYAPPTKDFSSIIMDLKSAGADVVFSVPTPPQSIMIVKQMKELNYAPKVTLFIRGPDLSTYWDAMGNDASYIISDGNWHESMPFPGNDRVVKDYMAANPNVKTIGIPVGCAYSAVQILAKAIETAGSLDREKIRSTISKVEMTTVRGPVKFRENGSAIVTYGFRQWQNGKNLQIWPKEVAVAKLLLAPPWDKR
ncbi:MAG: amino acid ABC transporter substrate-binding protein [Thermodesulfobacteriota bacterium]